MWHLNIEFFFPFLFQSSPNDLKLFCGRCLVPYHYHDANVPVLFNFFHDFINFFSDWSRVKCIFDIKISRLKILELAMCHTYWYCIMYINITNFFSSLSHFLLFFYNKISKCSVFLLYFHSFSRRNNFWLNKQVSQFLFNYSMICHLSY